MSSSSHSNLNRGLAESVDLFLMRKFEQCFDLCKEIIALAKIEPEQERNEEVIEAGTALGIQALAESDSWNQAFSFVNEVYGAIDLCPPRIIEVCILLHAHMREYMLCHKLVQIWLQNPSNLTHKMCSQVIRIYTQHVIYPTKSFETLKQILHNCAAMPKDVKSSLLELAMSQLDSNCNKPVTKLERRVSQREPIFSYDETLDQTEVFECHSLVDSHDDVDTDDNVDDDETSKEVMTEKIDPYSPVQSALLSLFQNMCSFLKSRIKILQNRHVQVMLMAVIAVLALIHSQSGDPVSSLGRLVILWRVFLQRLGLIRQR